MPAEDSVPEAELVPEEEELGPTEAATPAEEGVIEEAELVSEEAEAWEDLGPEVDEVTQMNMVTSALGLGPLAPGHKVCPPAAGQLAGCPFQAAAEAEDDLERWVLPPVVASLWPA